MSHYLSIERNEDISYVDLIREALEQAYPLPEEKISNGSKKNKT